VHTTICIVRNLADSCTGDDIDPDKRLIGTLAALGTIKVEIYKAKFEPRRPRSVLAADTTPPVPHGRISEKLLKGMALTHQATYVWWGLVTYRTDESQYGSSHTTCQQ